MATAQQLGAKKKALIAGGSTAQQADAQMAAEAKMVA